MEARGGVAVTMGCLQALVSGTRLTQPNKIRCAHVIIVYIQVVQAASAHQITAPAPPCRQINNFICCALYNFILTLYIISLEMRCPT